ncbi:DEAD/DEAH box helicase [Enterococcus sp. RIT-PI-f]|uniref:DEAD/DEAH box helicase n=1 Tax=Enterococcus sp. RIT-PI-f TaxID=1690244 RepID=UPI0006B9D7ED|nr:DEAD/DEAH box helicase [Enterococcus sp. RIT-PI-f]KPG69459.1 Snf2 family helicase [Enterococcus sp. RIT-PI-f]
MKWSIPEKVIERGRTYLNEDRVLSVTPDPEKNVWHAEVLGAELYLVTLDATAKEVDYCQCPYWDEHHYCKHTVAVELYLRKQGKTRMITEKPAAQKQFSPSEMFSNGFARLTAAANETVPLQIEYHVDTIPTNPYHQELDLLGISLKIGYRGTTRNYVVKNIYKFLQMYQEKKSYTANKQFDFLLTDDAFDAPNQALLQRLAGIAQTQQLIGQAGIQVNGKLDKKYLLLPVEYGKELLAQMNTVFGRITIGDHKLKEAVFATGNPLQFDVQKVEDRFVLRMLTDFDYLLNHYNWGLIEGQFFELTSEQKEIYLTMQQLFKRFEEPIIDYPKDELATLFMKVLPHLRKIGTVVIGDAVGNEIEEAALQVVFSLRKIKGQIDLQVDFTYGDVVFSSDPKYQHTPADHPEILRDFKQEARIEQVLDTLGYQASSKNRQKELPLGEHLYAFFTKEVPILRQLGTVRIGKKLRELYLDAQHHRPQIAIEENGSWLDIKFDISGIAETEIDAVLRSLLQSAKFYTTENGQVLSLESEAFQEASAALQQLRMAMSVKNGAIQVPLNQGLMLQEQFTAQADFSEGFKQMTEDLIHPEGFHVSLPQALNAELRHYQETGFRWLKMLSHYHFGGILADEMGLGKTVQTISYLLSEKEEKQQLSALIVAPASLTYNWQQELTRFAPSLTACVISGSKEEREVQLQQTADIRITSYASLRQDIDSYQELNLTCLILDEAQMVKNSATKTAQALRSLQVPQRFALSGTPIENNLEELWSLFQMIMPGFFPSKQGFKALDTQEIAKMIKPFILRRDKKSVLHDLPEKLETNYYSVLTEEQKKIYLAYLRQMREEIAQMDSASFRKNRISILAGLTRLRQICCDPRLFVEDYQGSSGKLEQVKDLLAAAKENGRRVLLFSQFTSMLSLIETELAQEGFNTFYLRGSTPPQERLAMVDAFNSGEKDVFLISLKAGGTGLNLTGADTVILYDLWWNPAVEEQAAGRAHRIGQQRVVEVWRMIAEGTIEERMDALQQEKRELFQKVIQGNETQLQQMTEEDIRLILSIGEETYG